MAIELRENNLYVNGRIIQFSDGQSILIRDKISYVGQAIDVYHTVMDEDELTKLAWRYYRSVVIDPAKYWWVIADVNNIFDPFDLSSYIGKDLLIPNLLTIKLTLSIEQ